MSHGGRRRNIRNMQDSVKLRLVLPLLPFAEANPGYHSGDQDDEQDQRHNYSDAPCRTGGKGGEEQR